MQWTPETEGEKSLSAKVTDADGNTQGSAITTLYVGNRMPTVTLTSHTNYDAVDLGQPVQIQAAASDVTALFLVSISMSMPTSLVRIVRRLIQSIGLLTRRANT